MLVLSAAVLVIVLEISPVKRLRVEIIASVMEMLFEG